MRTRLFVLFFLFVIICLYADDLPIEKPLKDNSSVAREMELTELENDFFCVQVNNDTGEMNIGFDKRGGGHYVSFTFSYPGESCSGWFLVRKDGSEQKSRDRVDSVTSITFDDEIMTVVFDDFLGLKLIQEYTLFSYTVDTTILEMLKMEAIFINTDDEPHDIGYIQYFDTRIDHDDHARIFTTLGESDLATLFSSPDVPYAWFPDPHESVVSVAGLLRGIVDNPPEHFWYGAWGATVTNSYSISDWEEDTGSRYGDSAVMTRWSPVTVAPGDTLKCDIYLAILYIPRDTTFVTCCSSEPELREDGIHVELVNYVFNDGFSPLTDITLSLDIETEHYEFTPESSSPVESIDYINNNKGACIFTYEIVLPLEIIESSIPFSLTLEAEDISPIQFESSIVLREENVSENISTPQELTLSAYPNPFNSSCYIELPKGTTAEIFDIEGKLVDSIEKSCNWSPATLESGVYTIRLTNSTEYKRIIYMK